MMKTLAVLGTLLLPWMALADSAPMECGTDPTYNPLGYFWGVTTPASQNPIMIQMHQNPPTNTGSVAIGIADASAAVERAFEQWNGVSCAGSAANVRVEMVAGLYDRDDRGDVWTTAGLVEARNIILWDKTGAQADWGSGIVGYTEARYFTATGYMVDADMMFNDRDFQWRTLVGGLMRGCTEGQPDCYDIEAVALHEAGHFLGFGHVDCVDSIMYRTGTGTSGNAILSDHERAGLCALYGADDASSDSGGSENCSSATDCPAGQVCISWPPDSDVSTGSCATACTTDTECGDGYQCVTETVNNPAETLSFCRPGQPESQAGDLCLACSQGADCETGLCATDGTHYFCSKPCLADVDCPASYICSRTDDESGVCWPIDPTNCGVDTRSDIDRECYVQGGGIGGEDWENSCAPGLICVYFKPRCEGQMGACVWYCDAATACPDEHQQCCFGIDETGTCLGPSAERHIGGCYDIRDEGQACVLPTQSVCGEGLGCFHFGEPTQAKCYEYCTGNGSCDGPDVCSTERFGAPLADACNNQFEICCDSEADGCLPGQAETLRGVGMICDENVDCESNYCLKRDGTAACSSYCNPITGVGCPDEDADVDGDGEPDGGFDCILISGEGRCWPRQGPLAAPPTDGPDGGSVPPPSGCCSALANPISGGDLFMNLLAWLPLFVLWRRGRRR